MGTLATVGFTLLAMHYLADMILQTDWIAAHKMCGGRDGIRAALTHGAHHLGAYLAGLIVLIAISDTPVGTAVSITAGLAFIVGTHMFIDLRWPVRWILRHTGSAKFAELQTPINGMFETDQALHKVIIWITSVIIVAPTLI